MKRRALGENQGRLVDPAALDQQQRQIAIDLDGVGIKLQHARVATDRVGVAALS